MNKKWKKGSFTIEASIIIPFLLFLMIQILQIGIAFYQQSVTRNIAQEKTEFDAVAVFYQLHMMEKVKGELLDEKP